MPGYLGSMQMPRPLFLALLSSFVIAVLVTGMVYAAGAGIFLSFLAYCGTGSIALVTSATVFAYLFGDELESEP